MLERFKDFVQVNDLFDPHDQVLLAVSGGVDSMVMADLFLRAKFKFGVAHCNFQLRGKDSDEDQVFVERYCRKHSIPFFTEEFLPKNYAEEHGVSIQMAARELRYPWFNTVAEQRGYHWIATAHQLNDNIETVLFRLTHGAGLDQLTGIPLKNKRVIRPLLFASRDEIYEHAVQHKIQWREDSSNGTDHYARNFIRHEIVPKLKKLNPSLEHAFKAAITKMQGAHELAGRALEQLKDHIIRREEGHLFIDKNLLLLMNNPAYVCYELLKEHGFDWDRCVQMVNSLGESQPGKKFLSATHQAVIDREQMVVSPLSEWAGEVLIEEGQDKAGLGPWLFNLKKTASTTITREPNRACLDLAKLRFPILWRKWKSGDSFVPLGMKQRKKVSDLLIDTKVSLSGKSDVTVVESGGEIVWVAGHRIDDRFKVTPETKRVLEITISHI